MVRAAMAAPRPVWIMACLFALGQVVIPLARRDGARVPPFSGRFSWSMFAGPLTGRCAHDLTLTAPDGRALPLRLPDGPVGRVLAARTPDEFVVVAPLLRSYADSDAELADALDDLLGRYQRAYVREPSVLRSALRCESPLGPPFRRTLRRVVR